MRRRGPFWLTLLACAPATAQFSQLAVTDDGSAIYFRTIQRLKSEDPGRFPQTGAIHRFTGGALSRVNEPQSGFPIGDSVWPQVSGDGSVVLFHDATYCLGGSSCLARPTAYTPALTIGGVRYGVSLGAGTGQLSRNGRYLLVYFSTPTASSPVKAVTTLYDLKTGVQTILPVRPAYWRQAVASDGTVLGFDEKTGALTLWGPQSSKAIALQGGKPDFALMNDTAQWLVYQGTAAKVSELRSADLATGSDALLDSAPTTFQPSIDNAGDSVLYWAGDVPQVRLARRDGSGRRQLTDFAEGVGEAILSGDGRTAVAVTGARLVAIRTSDGVVRELIGRTPTCDGGFTSLTPGSLLTIRGSAMAERAEVATPPLPDRLGGISVTADGVRLPLSSVGPSEIWFQVPFGMAPGTAVMLEVENSSLFDGCAAVRRQVVERAPFFFGQSELTLAHQDFTGLVTPGSPARPGEVVTAWAIGLGAVAPEVPTGVPTPVDRPSRLTLPFECHEGYGTDGPPVDVVFAGLAPTMIGIYQVSVRIPAPAPSNGFLFLNCGTPGSATERHGGAISIRP